MSDLRTAAQQALEAWDTRAGIDTASRAFEALRAALAQQDEPQTLDEALTPLRAMEQAYENGYKAGEAHEREAIARLIEDAPVLVPLAQNDQGGCMMCGFNPKSAASYIRARSKG